MARDEIQVVVDRLAEELRRSVVINDPGVQVQYTSPHFGDEDAVRVRAVLQHDAGAQAIGHVLAQGVSTWMTGGIIPPNAAFGMKARWCVPLRWRDQLLGLLIVIDGDGTLTASERESIQQVADGLAPVLAERMTDDPDVARELTVLDLVDRDPLLRRRALGALAHDEQRGRFALVTAIHLAVNPSSEPPAPSHVVTALRHALAAPVARGENALLGAVSGSTAVLLVGSSVSLAPEVLDVHAALMVGRVHDLSAGRFVAVAGIGAPARGLDQADVTARQARLAARAAATVLHQPVGTWTDLGAYGPLLRIPEDELGPEALPDEVRRLLDIDPDHHLTETLRAYLDSGCSGPAASEALHIHRTTLYYRLGRITELTGLDVADGRTRLVLHLGLTMLDLIEGPPRH